MNARTPHRQPGAARRLRLDDLARLAMPSQPAISPDGTTVVYALSTVDEEADEQRSALWWVPVGGGTPAPLTRGGADSSPGWSPDGSRLAFLRADGDGEPAQLWLLPATAGEPVRLTTLPGGAGAPVWSPDGTRIAFTAPVDPEPDRPAHAPVVADRLDYKVDGVGLWRGRRRQVFVAEPATGEVRQLTRGDWHAGTPAWSPDGRRLAFPAATGPDADLTGESVACVVDVGGPAGGTPPRPVGDRHGTVGVVGWTPDGEALLVVGQREVRVGHARLLRVPLAGGEVTTLAAELDRNVMSGIQPGNPGGPPQFAPDGHTLLFCVRDRGCTHLYALDGLDAAPRLVLGGPGRVVSALSVAAGAPRAAVVLADSRSFGEVAVVDLDLDLDLDLDPAGAEPVPLTGHTLADVSLFDPQERMFTISDGTEVHGWLLRDPAAPTPAPLLLDIHGGPHNAWNPVPSPGHLYRQLLAARGWAVLTLNPRASDGYGEAFYTAAVGGWGVSDERDFLEPVDQLVDEGVADPARLAVTGYSYGGYLTCWLTGRTDRFAAAVAGGTVSDLTSVAGTSDAGYWLIAQELGTLPYQDPARLAAHSPYTRVGEVRTPTLILQGAADDRTPVGQAEQWFAALRGQRVPTRLVLYPDGSHLFFLNGRPSHRADYARRLVDWVTRHTQRPIADARDHWQRRLAELARRYQVPGAALGIARGDERIEVACGVTNLDTGVEVTPDTLFQLGSITKVYTATVVMRLVEEGKLDLDKPVVSYLPELTLSDPGVTDQVTMRHLLTHTSGIDGDFFRDTGRGDDCLERYVAALTELPQNHPIGATFSYCNTGYSIAGRVIEVLTGQVWDTAMRELLFAPLGLRHTVTLPEEAMLYRAAVGHLQQAGAPPRRTEVWSMPRSTGPAAAGLTASVGDLLTFARLHLAGGVTADGTRLLSPQAVAAMQAEQASLPELYDIPESWGLGWFRLGWHGARLVGHDGSTVGQYTYLRVLPEHDLAVALLTNGGQPRELCETVVREVVGELTGVEMAHPVTPSADRPEVDIAQYAGTYQRTGMRYEVWAGEQGPRLRITSRHGVPGIDRPSQEYDLVPVHDNAFAILTPGAETWTPVVFRELPDGSPYLHLGYRATPKLA